MRWVCGLLLLLAACTDNLKIPSSVIDRERMEKILWEMMQADRFSNSFIMVHKDTLDRNKAQTLEVYDKVLAYNNITRKEFFESYNFYLGRPDLLKVMFDTISSRADRKKPELMQRRGANPERWHLDSLHNVAKRDSIRRHMDSMRARSPIGRVSDSVLRLQRKDSIRLRQDSIRKARLHRALMKTDSLANTRLNGKPGKRGDTLRSKSPNPSDTARLKLFHRSDSLTRKNITPQPQSR